MTKPFLILFALDSIALLLGEALSHETLIFCTKPLLMPLLAAWLLSATMGGTAYPTLRRSWLLGLLFSTLGDTLLMFAGGPGGSSFFLMGLAAFLLAHCCYIAGFWSVLRRGGDFLPKNKWLALPFAAYLLSLLTWLWPDVPLAMRLPVAVYATVICTMAWSAFHLRGRVEPSVFQSIFTGALLFVLSDSLIALHKFGHPFSGAHGAIMVTYIAGQWLLARGVAQI